jgi:hypothetical protein
MAKRTKRRYSRGAGNEVKREMHRFKRGSTGSRHAAACQKASGMAITGTVPEPGQYRALALDEVGCADAGQSGHYDRRALTDQHSATKSTR